MKPQKHSTNQLFTRDLHLNSAQALLVLVLWKLFSALVGLKAILQVASQWPKTTLSGELTPNTAKPTFPKTLGPSGLQILLLFTDSAKSNLSQALLPGTYHHDCSIRQRPRKIYEIGVEDHYNKSFIVSWVQLRLFIPIRRLLSYLTLHPHCSISTEHYRVSTEGSRHGAQPCMRIYFSKHLARMFQTDRYYKGLSKGGIKLMLWLWEWEDGGCEVCAFRFYSFLSRSRLACIVYSVFLWRMYLHAGIFQIELLCFPIHCHRYR